MGRPATGYTNRYGDKVPGTTTIIGRWKDSGGLLHWAFAQGKLAERGLIKSLYDSRDKAAESGTIAHDMIEAHILGRDHTPPACDADVLRRAENAYSQYLEWRDNTRLEILATETPYVSERYQFGGTIDAVGRDNRGRIVLIDWKTSNSVYSDYLIQLAAYALLLEECKPEYTPAAFHLLRVAKESADFAHHFYGELEDGKKAFVLMRELWSIDKRLQERTK